MKHPKFRVPDVLVIQQLAPEVMLEIEQVVRQAVATLPFADQVADIELCGSYVFGNALLASDMDFNIAMPDWNTQVAARRAFYGGNPEIRGPMSNVLQAYRAQMGINLDVGCVSPDNKQSILCYSFNRHQFFDPQDQRPEGKPVFQHLRFDTYTWSWQVLPDQKRVAAWSEDLWLDVLPEWKQRYGLRFQTWKEVPVKEGRKMIQDGFGYP